MSIPARTVSAPNSSTAPFRSAFGGHPHLTRAPNESRVSPPSALPTGVFKAKVTATQAPDAASSSAASPIQAAPSSAASPPPSSMTPQLAPRSGDDGKPRTLAEVDPLWDTAMRNCTDEAGEKFMNWAKSLWNSFGIDSSEKPKHLFDQRVEGLFGGPSSTARRTLIKERTLPNHVMGILSRVTPDNYEAIEEELKNLPIRQSEDSEIAEIINVFFKKAIRPEDSIYAPQYARLISALVKHIEEKEREKAERERREGSDGIPDRGVSKVIRSAVVNKCRDQYENLPELVELQSSKKTDDPEATEAKRRDLTAKLKANIGFLGQLFIHRLVAERVVIAVLYSLMWGPQGTTRASEDYEVEQFSILLEVCGPHISQQNKDTYQESFITSLQEIANTPTTTMRTKVLALNCKELIENNYIKRGKKAGPMKLDEYQRQAAARQVEDLEKVQRTLQQNQAAAVSHAHQAVRPAARSNRNHIASPTGPVPTHVVRQGQHGAHVHTNVGHTNVQQPQQPQQPQPMSEKDFGMLIETITKGYTDSEFTASITIPELNVPADRLVGYFTEAIYRYVQARKWEKERKAIGPIMRAARDCGVISTTQIGELVKALTERCVDDDAPIIFETLCEVFDTATDIFGYTALNAVLRHVFSRTPACSFEVLGRAVKAVTKRAPERAEKGKEIASSTSRITTPVAAGGDFPKMTATRVHLLPHVLRFVGYTSSNGGVDEYDEEDEDLVKEREEFDVIDEILDKTTDLVEEGDIALLTFGHLLRSCAISEDGVDAPNITAKDAVTRTQGLLPSDSVKIKSLNNPWIARKVLSAIFIYARFNRKLLGTLMSTVAKPLFEDKNVPHCTALLMEFYETWIELDRKPYGALDVALEYVFACLSSSFAGSTPVDTLFREIHRNGDADAVPNTIQRFRKNAPK